MSTVTDSKAAPKLQIKHVRFLKAVDIRPKGMTEALKAGKMGGVEYAISYEPAIRHFRISSQSQDERRLLFVPESSVLSWEPLD